jgi:hypothetical protein
MAKKKSQKKRRSGEVTEKDLRGYADQLAMLQAELIALADAMKVSKIRSFRVDGVNKFATAKEQLQEYLISVERYFKLKKLEEM